jgi:hypothetical protein
MQGNQKFPVDLPRCNRAEQDGLPKTAMLRSCNGQPKALAGASTSLGSIHFMIQIKSNRV